MGIFSLSAMLVTALIAIAVMSLFGDNALFMSGLLQGAWLTLQITVLGCLLAVIMATIGLAAILRGLGPVLFGKEVRAISLPIGDEPITLGPATLPPIQVLGAVVAVAFFIAFSWFFKKSRMGVAMRAVADNPGLIRSITYRPSTRVQFRRRLSRLDATESELVFQLGEDAGAPLPPAASPERQMAIIDTALDLVAFRHGEELLDPGSEASAHQQRLLSLNITGAWISEFREVPLPIVQAVYGRCGRFVPLGVQKNAWSGLIAESNPPDEDSDWYNSMEIETPPDWAVFKQPGGLDPNAENRQYLKTDYYEKLASNNTPDWVEIHVHGKYGKSLSGERPESRTELATKSFGPISPSGM